MSDYPNGFKNISGEQVRDNPQAIEFESKAVLKESTRCRIFTYSSTSKDIYSWEAERHRTRDFNVASRKFRTTYNSLQYLFLKVNGINAVFRSEYVQPSELIKFTTLVFDTGDKTPELKRLKISLSMENEMVDG